MCGIAGIVSKTSGGCSGQVKAAAETLKHRGPDAAQEWTNGKGNVYFGHQRLCVIDVSEAAAQPMHYRNRYTIIYNGEIYNYLEVKKELSVKGHAFQNASDTEVILAAYAQWGAGCLQHFDGAFAFAIWDEEEQTLFAARDRFGEKPFYFFYDEQRLVFASEIKALWQSGIEKRVNHRLLYNFITLGYTSNPADAGETFYNNVHKLPAAHHLLYSLATNEVKLEKYWQADININNKISEEEAIRHFTVLFADSIRKRLRSDVAIGTSLSGGLDSSSIVAFCHREATAQYTHKCFTATFAGFEKDETAYASLVAKQFSLQHFTTTVHENEVAELMEKVAAQQDEPFSSASVLSQYKVFEAAKGAGVTVLLDGQGADEVLAGYGKYYKWYWRELYRTKGLSAAQEIKAARSLGINEPFGLRNKAAALLPDFTAAMLQTARSKSAFNHPHLNRDFAFAQKRSLYYALPTEATLNGALYYNTFVNGLEELLRLADRNSMAHSVEVRLPFLSHPLVEFLFTLPPHFKIQQGWTKWLLRKSVEERLPKEIVWRKDKVGYEPPQKRWMQNRRVQERIFTARKKLVDAGILNDAVLKQQIFPKDTHEAKSYDWRYWSAAHLF